MHLNLHIKRLLFYWLTSYAIAILLYYVLLLILPGHKVFGVLYRMFTYHEAYPLSFIAIPCFFFGIFAALFTDRFSRKRTGGKILLLALILVLVMVTSVPFGGMLWHYYDMLNGFFPENWISKMIVEGFKDGLEFGWLILLISIPYNIVIAVSWYFLMLNGNEISR